MSKKPLCMGCPPCCTSGCTWDNAEARPLEAQPTAVIVSSNEYGCIHGGAVIRTGNGKLGLLRPESSKFPGFAEIKGSGAEFLRTQRPEFAAQIGL